MPPSLTPIGQQPSSQTSQSGDSVDMAATTFHKAQLVEKKRQELENIQEQRKRYEATMAIINQQEAIEKEELVTGLRSRNHETVPEHSATMGLGHINTTSFLFGDDDDSKESTTSPDVKNYLQMNATDDKFPILVRRNEFPGVLSASSAALDLALSQSPGPETQGTGWVPFARHRLSQQGLSQNLLNSMPNGQLSNGTTNAEAQKPTEAVSTTRNTNRHSMEASLAAYSQTSQPGQVLSVESGRPTTLGNIHSSYSTNDVPTLKKANGSTMNMTPPKTQAQQQFHNHNASLGRIPANVLSNRNSRELSGGDARREDQLNGFQQANSYQQALSGLQASAAPFGPATTAASPVESMPSPMAQLNNALQFQNQAFYPSYGMMMNMGMTPIHMANFTPFQNQVQTFQHQNGFTPYPNYGMQGRFQDSQARVIQQRRMQNGEENARFTNVKLEQLQGEILALCKDQHGCRYLQKKLEERNAEHVHIIFLETHQHVVELMTDPFGNYLCQKLLEFSNDDQRTVLINNAAPEMVKIALNSHGTRALQKMIEFVSTPEQIQTVTNALTDRVVELIQDLNGNHVIQKCLNRLSPEDAQFIFDTVGLNCVAVGTHRHGCCVLQRCIDHATGIQKAKLISQITANAFHLVQDPFGNYVLQYIVDLQEECFTNPLCHAFQGQIPSLSKQKFSSNVIEKCIRGAEASVTRMMIDEMLNANELERMLKDSYANYVVQTAIDYADAECKGRLVEAVRPLLPLVRQTPHGRRIQSKIMALEGQGRFSGSGTPTDRSSGQIPLGLQMTSSPISSPYAAPATNGYHGVNNGMNNGFVPQFGSAYPQYTPSQTTSNNYMHFNTNPSQQIVQQPAQSYPRIPQVNGGFF
ncbi:pumilio RNA-binding family, partial [Lecanoromycetidae sp. Uapishka_2]